jgi:hypothetical protein
MLDEIENVETRGPLTWDNLLVEFDSLSIGWLFRGQMNASWHLRTSLERHTPASLGLPFAENRRLSDFKRRAHAYLVPHQLPNDNPGEWLALMQHFGAPTRLLDMTGSPYVAAYFAVEDLVDPSHCAIWAVNHRWCTEACGRVLLTSDPAWAEGVKKHGAAIALSTGVTLDFIAGTNPRAQDPYQWLDKHISMIVPYVPQRLSERVSIQQGHFLVPRDLNRTFMQNLAALGNPAGQVIRFILPQTERDRALEQLRLMNITRASLFPGLEGFAQSFRQLLVGETVEKRALRSAPRS